MTALPSNRSIGPDVPTAGYLAARAEVYRSEGRHGDALHYGRAALARCAHYSSGHVVVGRSLLETGAYSQALEHLGKAVEIDAENALALRLLGDALALAGLDDEARAAYQRARSLGDQTEETDLALNLLASGGRSSRLAEPGPGAASADAEVPPPPASADTGFDALEASGFEVEDTFRTATMARICEEQGVLEAALQIYDSLREKHPTNSLLAGKAAQLRRRIEEAAAVASDRTPLERRDEDATPIAG